MLHRLHAAQGASVGGDDGSVGGGDGKGGGGGGGGGGDEESNGGEYTGPLAILVAGFKARIAADPDFAYKVLVEQIIGVGAAVVGEHQCHERVDPAKAGEMMMMMAW